MLEEAACNELERAAGKPGVGSAAMASLTTVGCGGPAAFMIEADGPDRLAAILAAAGKYGIPWLAVGRGSNLLVADSGWEGLIIRLSGDLRSCGRRGDMIDAGGGALLPHVVSFAAEQGLSGIEALASIPGTIGGAVAMNAGAFGTSIGDVVSRVEICLPGETRLLPAESLEFGYRHTRLPPGAVVSRVTLALVPGDPAAIVEAVMKYRRRRDASQPRGQTFGSVFKNPPGETSAGGLLDQAGCKGMASGGAVVSDVHANFILNRGGASAADVLDLMDRCRQKVFKKFGVALEPEVRLLGDNNLKPLT